ncbi:ATP-binding protein [Hafnia paralvei]|uniref:ATP-binding protein n=1 Tax=Hafnia paralvei TaxID=546367 RepID=UPI00103353C1|nr:ATP-binding protein [Hafnia paralvei]TBL62606.1 ATP-binding protein [Hafnia paralvei]
MILDKIEDALAWLSRYTLGQNFADYCDLRTVIGLTDDDKIRHPSMDAAYIQTTKNNDFVSCLEIKGAFRDFSFEESPEGQPPKSGTFQFFYTHLADKLTGDFKALGYKLSVVFEHDPDRGKEEMTELMKPLRRGWKRLHLDMDDLAQERIEKMSPYMARERVFLVVYTAIGALPADEHKNEIRRQNALGELPEARFSQNPIYAEFEGLKLRHDAFLDKLIFDMNAGNNGVSVRLMDAHETGRIIRDEIEKSSTSPYWQPLLPGDRVMPHGKIRGDGKDISACLAPHLNYQYCDTQVSTEGAIVEVDGFFHGQLAMTLFPQRPQIFPELFANVPRQVPWRLRFDIMPGGASQLGYKNFLLTFLAIIPALRQQYESVQWLLEQDKKDPIVVLSITASTWHRDNKALQRNLTLLKKSLQGWGIADVTGTFGDPVRAWISTLPAVSSYSGPNLMFSTLSDALRLLPLQQPCSPWSEGNVVYLTPGRKPFVIKLASPLQEKHTEIIMGPPGSGKSVIANSSHLSFLANSNIDIPFMLLIDKGYTTQGFYDIVYDALPDDAKHKIVSIVLKNTAEHCRNPMDIQLGLKAPLSTERDYILSLLKSLCADPATGLPPDPTSCADILGRIVDSAFKEKGEINPTRYGAGLVPEVDRALEESEILHAYSPEWWVSATWYEVRDMLFDKGYVSEATLAQSQAVPLLNDLQNELSKKELADNFVGVTRPGTQESLLQYVSRCLAKALTDYPLLSGRTRLIFSPETRIAIVDVNNVAGKPTPEGKLKTGIMYQFARQIGGGNDFYLPQIQDELYANLDPRYIPLHRKRIEQLDQETKLIFIDEMHNIKGVQVLWDALQTEDREQRKFGVRTVFASQYPDDYPPDLLESANSVYMMRVREKDFSLLTKAYQIPEITLRRLLTTPPGAAPDGSGTTFLGIFKTSRGNVAQLLKHAVGPRELWALNSTPADRALRKRLTEKLGSHVARELLATKFPRGSASAQLNHMKDKASNDDDTSVVNLLANQLLSDYGYLQG